MGMRELLILILILAIIGVILRGLYLAVRSRRGQLKIALEKNVPEYDLEEIELRELPNGGARVVERSFAHVQKENQRFAGRKTRASQQARAAASTRTPLKTASVKPASSASRTSQSIPVLMNSVSAGAGVQARSLDKAKEPPLMDDLISALDDELDQQLESENADQMFNEPIRSAESQNGNGDGSLHGYQAGNQGNPANSRNDAADYALQDELQDDLQDDLQEELQEVLQEELQEELQEMLEVQQSSERDGDDYMEPTRIEVEMLEDDDQPEVAALHVSAEPPVLTEPVRAGTLSEPEPVTARANPEADGHYDDDTETNYDSYEADQHIDEQSYTEVDGPADELEEVFISKKGDRDIIGNIDSAEIDFDDEAQDRRRSQVADEDTGSAMTRLKGWGAKLFGRSGRSAGRPEERPEDSGRGRATRDDDDILFDAPLKRPVNDDDFDVGVSSVRESPRGAARKGQAQQPQQQSLLNMDDEGAPLAADPALHEESEKPFADKAIAKSQSQAEKSAQAPGRLHSRPAAGGEAARISHNNNIAPDYSEVLIVNVMARGDSEFAGVELLPAMLSCGLRFGEMSIFHRHVDDKGVGPVLFSVANILNPGTFDLNEVNDFSTRGVCFFLTLPNVINNMQAFDRMIDTAQRLREALDGEMKDDNRSVMTAQTIEHYRQRIRDFELRQLRQH